MKCKLRNEKWDVKTNKWEKIGTEQRWEIKCHDKWEMRSGEKFEEIRRNVLCKTSNAKCGMSNEKWEMKTHEK